MSNSVFAVDSRVVNWQSLVGAAPADARVVVLDGTRDGIEQLASAVGDASDLSALYILSHGTQGSLYLGSSIINAANLETYRAQLGDIGHAMSESGDILLFGCDVAAGDAGSQFVHAIADMTGADVAASTNATGGSAAGGDWVLEATTGSIEAPTSLSAASADYDYVLAGGGTIDFGKTIYVGGGPDRYFDQVNTAHALALQADGKIVLAGETAGRESGIPRDFGLVRLDAAGNLDTTFSGDGRLATPIGWRHDGAFAVVIQQDAKIVAVGDTEDGTSDASVDKIALVRYLADGTLDASYGSGGIVRTLVQQASHATGAALQADGKLVVAGWASNGGVSSVLVARYNADGSLDTTFSDDGIVTTVLNAGAVATAVRLQSDGRIVVAGHTLGADPDFLALRYLSDGRLDTSFSGDGIVTTALAGEDHANGLAIQADGRIVLAGETRVNASGTWDYALTRYNTNGTLDTGFSGDGRVQGAMAGNDRATGIALQQDGRLVISGMTDMAALVARYDATGELDAAFGAGGIVTYIAPYPNQPGSNAAAGDAAYAIGIQEDGKILTAGYHRHSEVGWGVFERFELLRMLSGDAVSGGLQDFNGDVKSDVLMRHDNGAFQVLLSTGASRVSAGSNDWVLVSARADFDGDGKTDIIQRHEPTGNVEILQMGGLDYTARRVASWGVDWRVEDAQGDFNRDGRTDLILKHVPSGTLEIMLMNGLDYSAVRDFSLGPGWKLLSTAGDFNGDGKSDLLLENAASGRFEVMLMNGLDYTQAADFIPGNGWGFVSAANDFNGDGKSDLLLQHAGSETFEILQMDGVLYTASRDFGGAGYRAATADHDFNGDGKSDLLLRHEATGTLEFQQMNGLDYTDIRHKTFGPEWKLIDIAADFNGDAKSDFVVQSDSGIVRFNYMNGLTITTGGDQDYGGAAWHIVG